MKVVFSPRSVQRLREIQAYIAYDNVTAAARVVARIRQSIGTVEIITVAHTSQMPPRLR